MLLRQAIGTELRRRRRQQAKTLRELSTAARVSLPYLSEIERGRKEASSEILVTICRALGVPLNVFLREVSFVLARETAPIAAITELAPARRERAARRSTEVRLAA
jgi:transcriptional regulator with XRE-family HTH domain